MSSNSSLTPSSFPLALVHLLANGNFVAKAKYYPSFRLGRYQCSK